MLAFPDKKPLNVPATNLPAVVSRYTPVSNIWVPVFVVEEVVPVIYALVVVARVLVTFVSVSIEAIVTLFPVASGVRVILFPDTNVNVSVLVSS